MISLEQVQLLETRVAKAIEYVQRVTDQNAVLVSERAGLQTKLEANQKRLDELEVLVMRFKEDHGRVEDGILAALDRLSQFEEAFENSFKDDTLTSKKPAGKQKTKESESAVVESSKKSKEFFEIKEDETIKASELDMQTGEASGDGELDIF